MRKNLNNNLKRIVAGNGRSGNLRERSSSTGTNNIGWYLTGGYHNADMKRDVWQVAGYPEHADFHSHWNMFNRHGIAYAGIMRIVMKCWSAPPIITDGDDVKNRALTPFEEDLKYLVERKALWTRMKGCDWRQRVGRYGGIIPIAKEQSTSSSDKPMSQLMGVKSILKLVPVFESQIDVTDVGTNDDLDSERFGMPDHYNFRQYVDGDRNPISNNEMQLDPSRVFVYAEGADDGSIFGTPANESGFNDLLDLEKYVLQLQRVTLRTPSSVLLSVLTIRKLQAQCLPTKISAKSGTIQPMILPAVLIACCRLTAWTFKH